MCTCTALGSCQQHALPWQPDAASLCRTRQLVMPSRNELDGQHAWYCRRLNCGTNVRLLQKSTWLCSGPAEAAQADILPSGADVSAESPDEE